MSGGSLRDAVVLVTGGAGFIGWRLCRRLAAEGARVHGTVHRRPLPPEAGDRVSAHTLDLADADAARALVDRLRPDVLLHLASHVVGARDRDVVRPTFDANLASTVALLDAIAGTPCRRFVQIGSLEEPGDDAPATATPSSPYAAAKWAASAYGRMFHALFGAPVVQARLFMVYGPGQWDTAKLVPYTILSLLRGEPPTFSSGTRAVDWVFVDDVVDGLVRLAAAPRIEGARVDLGSGTQHTVRAVVEAVFARLAPDTVPAFGDRADRAMEQVRTADVDATDRLIGWRPATDLEDGIERTIAWYRRAVETGQLSEEA